MLAELIGPAARVAIPDLLTCWCAMSWRGLPVKPSSIDPDGSYDETKDTESGRFGRDTPEWSLSAWIEFPDGVASHRP